MLPAGTARHNSPKDAHRPNPWRLQINPLRGRYRSNVTHRTTETPLADPETAPAPRRATTAAVTFGGCDYLGFSVLPAARAAAHRALDSTGLSTTASRTTTGDTPGHRALETELAEFLGRDTDTRQVTLLPDGYTANIAACEALAPQHPTALIDARAHASLWAAARAAGMNPVSYDHRNPTDLRAKSDRADGPVCVLTDGVFTADGALTPLPELLAALPTDATLVVDDCHGFGVLGPGGQGTAAHFQVHDSRLVVTSTLAKALGCAGGFVAATPAVSSVLRRSASAYVCTTPTAPAMVAAARAALAHLVQHADDLLPRLRSNAQLLRDLLRSIGIDTGDHPTPIAAFDLGKSNHAAAAVVSAAGFVAPLTAYPGGPSPEYFRVTVSAAQSPKDIERLIATLARALGKDAA
jgi:8-amino-7-oxononanoate synthase